MDYWRVHAAGALAQWALGARQRRDGGTAWDAEIPGGNGAMRAKIGGRDKLTEPLASRLNGA